MKQNKKENNWWKGYVHGYIRSLTTIRPFGLSIIVIRSTSVFDLNIDNYDMYVCICLGIRLWLEVENWDQALNL